MSEAKWYVVHTYSGYENKVKANIDKTIENRHLEDQILEVRVPMQDVVELKNGVQKATQKKMFPGYVLIHMIMNCLLYTSIVAESGDNCYDSGSFNRNSHILSGGSYEKREKYRGCDLYASYGAAAYSSRLFSVAPFWKKQHAWSLSLIHIFFWLVSQLFR